MNKIIKCKVCQQKFTQQEWLQNTACDCPELCGCPEVQRSMTKATQAINKAKEQAGYHVVRKEDFIPTNRDETVDQLYVSVSPVLSIEINKQRPRGKRV